MENNTVDNIMLGDKTLKQWEEEMQAPPIASSMSYQDAEAMGILSPQTEFNQSNTSWTVESPEKSFD